MNGSPTVDQVVVLEVVVDQGRAASLGLMAREPGRHRLGVGDLVRLGLEVALGPAGDLPLHVALGLPHLGERAAGHVDGVQRRDVVHEGGRERAHERGGELDTGRAAAPEDDAAQALHEVELGPRHG
jgi:hypothetical protein